MNSFLDKKVVVVTGGAGLIGREFVRGIVEKGGIGIIADIDIVAAGKVAESLRADLPAASVDHIQVDITSSCSITDMIDRIASRYGRIDALVNNAYPRNRNYGRKFEEVLYHDFCENVNLHLGGYFLVSQQIADFFKRQGQGNIVNVASIYGVTAPRFEIYDGTAMTMPVEYAVIKSAIIHLTKYMAKYLKGTGIRVNCLSPGGIFNDQPDDFVRNYNVYGMSKGMLDPADITGTLLYLLSEMSRYVNGQNIIVDDGWI